MVKEVDWQLKIIKRIREENGYGQKWATQLTTGVPDLITSIKGLGGVLTEVKLIKDLKPGWRRKIAPTQKQLQHLNAFKSADGWACLTVVAHYGPKHVEIIILPPPAMKPGFVILREDELFGTCVVHNWSSKPAGSLSSAYRRHFTGKFDEN